MLELLIGTLMTVGIQFTQLDDGKVAISFKDAETLRSSSSEYQMIIDEGIASQDVIVTEAVDPSSDSSQRE
jgi:hypothetical protein